MSRIEQKEIILASASPRRKELLAQIGISFTVQVSSVEEVITKTAPEEIVMELSAQKAKDVKKNTEEDCIVIGADTIVAYSDGTQTLVLGKPKSEEEAFRMLKLLQGNTHQVYTGVSLCFKEQTHTFYEKTQVQVYPMNEEQIWEYIKTGEPMDKAGAYGIQGRFAAFIKGIEGDYNNVVGLPVGRVYQELCKLTDGSDQNI